MRYWKNHWLTFNKILAILIAIVYFGWMFQEDPEIEEPIITVSYKCEIVLRNPNNIPDHVKQQCIKLLKDNYETESD
jgi:hypothetical protein